MENLYIRDLLVTFKCKAYEKVLRRRHSMIDLYIWETVKHMKKSDPKIFFIFGVFYGQMYIIYIKFLDEKDFFSMR